MTADEARAVCLRRVHELPDEDLPIVAALLAELPVSRLVARLERSTARGVEPFGEKVETRPVKAATWARTTLLRAVDAFGVVLGQPRKLREVSDYLRGQAG